MNKRPRVTKLSVMLRYPGGQFEKQHFDGESASAIVNSDRGVMEILAPFYNKMERYLQTTDLIKTFGSHITALTGSQERVLITPELVKKLWNFKNAGGLRLPFMIKLPECPILLPEILPGKSPTQAANGARPQISGLTLHLSYPDGHTASTTLEAGSFDGVFWGERAVMEILAPFYNTIERRLSLSEMIHLVGPTITSIVGSRTDIKITPQLVEDLWNQKNDEGLLPSFIIKRPTCPLGIPNPLGSTTTIAVRRAA